MLEVPRGLLGILRTSQTAGVDGNCGPLIESLGVRREDKTADLGIREGALDAALLALEAEIGDVGRAVIAEGPFLIATPPRHPRGWRPSSPLAGAPR